MEELVLPSGPAIPHPDMLVDAFFAEEWAYYDGLEDVSHDRIDPIDVVVTLSVNSFLNSATRIRSVHRGLAGACQDQLARIPVEADLRSFPVDEIIHLLHAACQVPYVLVPVATKVLHRKRRRLVPMLDTVVSDYYLQAMGRSDLRASTQDKRRAAEAARVPLEGFRNDLEAVWPKLNGLRNRLESAGFPVTELRLLEVLIWIWADPQRQYLRLLEEPAHALPNGETRGSTAGVGTFDVADLRSRGFRGFLPVRDLEPDPRQVPTAPGVYAVLRESSGVPEFVDVSPASWFKREDPTVPIERLREEWIEQAATLYIGSAADLRDRIGLLVDFSRAGRERSVFHNGGRLLWQLADGQELLVAWRVEPDGVGTVERDLVDAFKKTYGRFPYANLKRPPIRQ